MSDDWKGLAARLEALSRQLERLLPPAQPDLDWKAGRAYRWRRNARGGYLEAVKHPHSIRFADLKDIDEQKRRLRDNTAQFVAGRSANNVLLTGARGTGKSSLVKAALSEFGSKGLRLIEVDKADLVDLPDIAERVAQQPYRFVVFCDDLTFDAGEPGYKALKVMLDGSIAGASGNVVVYATSNRRHLLPEYFIENLETKHVGEEVHPGESVEEKISLSERFGLWVTFYPFAQDDYLAAVERWLAHFGAKPSSSAKETESRTRDALQWALQRGSRSGRAAWQFAKNYAGAHGLRPPK